MYLVCRIYFFWWYNLEQTPSVHTEIHRTCSRKPFCAHVNIIVCYMELVCTHKHRRFGSELVLLPVCGSADFSGPPFHFPAAAELRFRLSVLPWAHADQHLLHGRQLLWGRRTQTGGSVSEADLNSACGSTEMIDSEVTENLMCVSSWLISMVNLPDLYCCTSERTVRKFNIQHWLTLHILKGDKSRSGTDRIFHYIQMSNLETF